MVLKSKTKKVWLAQRRKIYGIAIKRFCQYYRASDISRSRGAAKSCEIHKNTTKTAKFGRNLINYMSVQHIWTYFSYRGYLLAVNLQIYLRTSWLKRANKVPKLPGVDYVVKNWALAIMLKALPLVPGFISGAYCCWKSKWWPLLEKRLKRWSDQRKTDWFLAKFALKITTKWAVFYRLLFGEVCPENSREIPAKSADFSANLSLKIPRNLTFSSATNQTSWYYNRWLLSWVNLIIFDDLLKNLTWFPTQSRTQPSEELQYLITLIDQQFKW